VYNQPSRAALVSAVNTLSGEVHSGAARLGAQTADHFLRVMLDDIGDVRSNEDDGVHFWSSVFGRSGRVGGDAGGVGSSRVKTGDENIAFGVDVAASPYLRLGAALSTGTGRAGLANNLGKANADILQLGGFAAFDGPRVSLRASGAYSKLDVKTNRAIPALNAPSVSAGYDVTAWSGRVEAEMKGGPFAEAGVRPYLALQAQSVETPAFTERGGATGGAFGVAAIETTNTTSRSELGATWQTATPTSRLYARAAWAHNFSQDTDFTASLVGLTNSRFTIQGAQAGDNGALLAFGGDRQFAANVSLGARLDADLAEKANAYSASMKLRVGF
jgi:uncharacterized protein with beta-barrel porin domain